MPILNLLFKRRRPARAGPARLPLIHDAADRQRVREHVDTLLGALLSQKLSAHDPIKRTRIDATIDACLTLRIACCGSAKTP